MFGTLAVLVVLTIVGSLVSNQPKQHQATVTGNFSAATSPSSTNPTSTPSNSTNDLSQQAAQDKALAAQDEANAEKDVKDAQNGQAALNSETPPSSSVSTPTVSLPPPRTITSPTCTGPNNLTSLYNAYIGAVGQLNGYESEINQPGGAGYGLSASAAQSEEQQQLTTLQNNIIQAQTAYQEAEAQVHCS